MPIRDPQLYSSDEIAPGRIATLENYRVNVETAGEDIKFGQAVVLKNGLAMVAHKAPIYGVALNRDWTDSEDFIQDEMDKDHWSKGNGFDVLRDGTISVPLSDDVNRGENATVDADGNFKAAGTSDSVVGVFLSAGNKGGTARLQTRIQFGHGNADDDTASSGTNGSNVQKDNLGDAHVTPGTDKSANNKDTNK